MRWTKLIEAATEIEAGQWRIGDAIAEDLSMASLATKPISQAIYAEAAGTLKEKGFDKYDPSYLAKLHRTAQAFPRADRNPDYAWDAHAEAGTPENFRKAAAALRKLDKSISVCNMRWLMQEWRKKADSERREANESAKREEAAAKKKAAAAAERALRAKNKKDKAKARRERDEAKEEARRAKQRKQETGSPPKFNTDIATDLHDHDTLDHMAIHLGIVQHLRRIEKEAIAAREGLNRIADSLTTAQQSEIIEGSNRIIDIVQQMKAVARGRRLQVVGGGAA